MTGQARHRVPVNKRQVVFLGMGVTKSNSEDQLGRELVDKLGLAFLRPQEGNWHPGLPMVSRAPTGESEHLSTAAQVTSQNDSLAGMKTASTWLTERSESKMTKGLQDLDSSSAELQHRKAARQEKEDILRATQIHII